MKSPHSPVRQAASIGILVATIFLPAGSAYADFTFGTPVNLGSPLNGPYLDAAASVSSEGLELYFTSNRPGGFGDWDTWVSTRASTEDGWSSPTNAGGRVNTVGADGFPCISADGLELYFISNRSGGQGNADLYVTTRATKQDAWGPPSNVAPVNSGDFDQWVCPSGDGLTLLFQSPRAGGQYGGLYMSKRDTKTSPWSAPVDLGLPAQAGRRRRPGHVAGTGYSHCRLQRRRKSRCGGPPPPNWILGKG